MTYTLLILGILWMICGMFLSTKDPVSTFIFKVFPFLSGAFVAVYAANVLGWITI